MKHASIGIMSIAVMVMVSWAALSWNQSAYCAGKVPEVDEFHKVLHPLVHDALPNKDYAAIREGLPALIESATKMSQAQLPEDLASKQKKYTKEAKKMLKQLRDMDRRKSKISDEALDKRFRAMHDTFEKIMGMVQ